MAYDFLGSFTGQIIGGGISGAVGILVAWYSLHKKTQQEVRETIYAPLYDGIMSLKLEPIFDGTIDDTWEKLESHKKLRSDTKITELYKKYEKLGKEHRQLYMEWDTEFHDKSVSFILSLNEVFTSTGIIFRQEYLPLKPHVYPVTFTQFVNWFKWILFDGKINDSKELYKQLLDYAKIRFPDLEEWLQKLHEEKPECYDLLFQKLKEINKDFPKTVDYTKLIEKRSELKELIIEIRKELTPRVKIAVLKRH